MYKGHLLSTANWVTQLTSGVWGSSETDKLPGERCPPLTDAGWGALGLHSGGRGLCTCTQGHFWCVHKSSVCHHASTDCLTTEKHKVLLGVKCLGCGLWAVGAVLLDSTAAHTDVSHYSEWKQTPAMAHGLPSGPTAHLASILAGTARYLRWALTLVSLPRIVLPDFHNWLQLTIQVLD